MINDSALKIDRRAYLIFFTFKKIQVEAESSQRDHDSALKRINEVHGVFSKATGERRVSNVFVGVECLKIFC